MDNKIILQAINSPQEYKPSKTGSGLETLLLDNKIWQVSDEELRKAIKMCMLMVGIRAKTLAAMEEEEKQVIINFIRANYSGHTLAEFKAAFNKAVAGEIDADANAYENFSCEYIGRIMKAYRKWASVQYNESGMQKTYIDSSKQLKPSYQPLELVQIFYQEFLDGNSNLNFIPARCYDLVNDINSLQPSEEDEKLLIRDARTHVVQQYEKIKAFRVQLENLKKLPLEESRKDIYVDRYVKAILLVRWFEKQKEAGVLNLIETYSK